MKTLHERVLCILFALPYWLPGTSAGHDGGEESRNRIAATREASGVC